MLTRPIFLLGMMGAGKSSVGRELAGRERAVFVDLDARIELLFGAAVAQMFAQHGEAYFRACERTALVSLVDEPGFAEAAVVVATGGGVVCNPDNLRTMAGVGRSVYLEADVETLCARLSAPRQLRRRPLLDGSSGLRERLTQLLAAREQAYRSADVVVDARGSTSEVAARVLQLA